MPKRSGNDLLIIECNSTKLAADGMDLGTAFTRHEIKIRGSAASFSK